jgi:pyrroloquinoline quinone biosynthesis protein D
VTESALAKPQLAVGVRLRWDGVREQHVLLYPEGALVLNSTAADVLELCDGQRTIEDIAQELSPKYEGADVRDDVARLVTAIAERGLVVDADA